MARPSKRASDDDARRDESIDAILGGLEHVVKELESGELPLERALERFEEGVRLARKGSALLDTVEERIEMLLQDRDEVVPLRSGDEATSDDEPPDDEDEPF